MSYSSVTRFKRCSKCKVEYPRTFQFFHRGSRKQLFEGRCRLCRQRGNKSPTARLMTLFCPPGYRVCEKCAKPKPATLEYFHSAVESPSGLRNDCALCNTARVKDYYQENREVIIRKVVEYNRDNPARKAYMDEYLPEWHKRNPNYTRERARKRRNRLRQVPEHWADEQLKRRVEASRRRAAKTMAGGDCTPKELQQMYEDQGGLCAYCEIPLFGTYHADHMLPLSRGGSSDWTNIALTCPQCNIRKSAKTAEEFWLVFCK